MPIEDMVQVSEALGKVTIITRASSKIVIDDPNKTLCLHDINGNKIEMGPEGITITSVKDLTFVAAGHMQLQATGNITTAARADVVHTGLNISQTAQVGYVAKGNASAELSAAGTTTVKGAMVMIN
ncbi:MAG: hypothetical protein LCH79_08975 [Proteobacteria bacterium]|nr:hypothetical protein [Pseudomonadota bacterium]